MHLPNSWWASFIYVFDFATFSTWSDRPAHQATLQGASIADGVSEAPVFQPHVSPIDNIEVEPESKNPLIFEPPYSPNDRFEQRIECNYTAMLGWKPCTGSNDRGCWLRKSEDEVFDIHTNYEKSYPKGMTRKYTLDVTEKALAPDGVPMAHGKVFNGTFPGPWIQACWGDDVEITVRNHLRFNGTTIHWHGIRQLNNTENDGVNGVTQCPIAPGKEFTYKFKAMQYGSSWYHSHYSLQYADGLVGPMTIYGPSTDNYDYVEKALLMTDWNHRSAFEDWSYSLVPGRGRPLMTNILLNGLGRYIDPNTNEPVVETKRYTRVLEKGKRYVLQLINTSVDTSFSFSIDGHNLTVIGADFVPIKPYNTSSVMVAIGQRYHVVLIADPIHQPGIDNYWIRTIPANGCGIDNFANSKQLRNTTGIIRYNATNTNAPTSSKNPNLHIECTDEPYDLLVPELEWKVGNPANSDVENDNNTYDVVLQPIQGHPYRPEYDRDAWNIDNMPLWLDFAQPTILNLNTPEKSWAKYLDVVTKNPKQGEWIYLVVTGNTTSGHSGRDRTGSFIFLAHPIHLHGHDFAILKQSSSPYPGWKHVQHELNRENPPRRDVALLPSDGYLVIAFKADNPGTWLLHCHIAWHASSGLAMQILENTRTLSDRLLERPQVEKGRLVDTCNDWKDWVEDPRNHYDPHHPGHFQDDSGI